MSASPNLKLPYIDANQNQKSVTHNEALRMLDALVNLHAASATLTAPPASPSDGQCWIVASGGSGAWLGKDLNIAAWQDGAWSFYAPNPGFVAYVDAIGGALMWNGSAWVSLLNVVTQLSLGTLGIGTAADPANPLSAKLNSALFTALPTTASPAGTGHMRVVLSKQAAGNTASVLFQDNYSGRAEFGLTGDDNFHMKVSPDGSTFYDAIVIAASGGAVSFLASPTAPTQPQADNSTRLATTAYADRAAAANFARTQVNDTAYTVLPSDRTVAVIALTAARTLTLPAASAYPQGATLTVVDESGACSATITLTLARAGADTINGSASAVLSMPYGYLALESNGSNKWTIIDQSTGTLAQQNKNAVAITGGSIDGTTLGATTKSAGGFTTLTTTGAISASSGGHTFGSITSSYDNTHTSMLAYNFSATNFAGMGADTNGDLYVITGVAAPVPRWTFTAAGNLSPWADNIYSLGTAGARASVIYAATGAINTSDAIEKSICGEPTEAVFDAVMAVPLVEYQWNEAVAKKGSDAARLHFGATAQAVRDAFAARGLDPRRYALFCEDDIVDRSVPAGLEGDARAEAVAAAQAKPPVIRYGIRYDQFDRLRQEAIRRKLVAAKLI